MEDESVHITTHMANLEKQLQEMRMHIATKEGELKGMVECLRIILTQGIHDPFKPE